MGVAVWEMGWGEEADAERREPRMVKKQNVVEETEKGKGKGRGG